jgi:uncharacterized membrane protein YfcA
VHKELTPVTGDEIIGGFLVVFLIITSSMGGLGGGGSLIPVIMLLYGFSTKEAIGLSNASICVASIYRYLYNFKKPHPLKEPSGTLIDYNMATLMLPMIVIGASVGVMANTVLPSLAVAAVLFLVMAFISYVTVKKWIRIVNEEAEKFGPVCGRKGRAEVDELAEGGESDKEDKMVGVPME